MVHCMGTSNRHESSIPPSDGAPFALASQAGNALAVILGGKAPRFVLRPPLDS